uniref:PiggyBac transposable element-derived protein domain-containing protein n=1 Tax=Oryzias latipes TaxID=8090 RepID=A0A3B3H8F7_ORYLA
VEMTSHNAIFDSAVYCSLKMESILEFSLQEVLEHETDFSLCPSDMGPSTKRKRLQPAVEVLQDSGSDSYSEDYDDDDNEQPAPQAKRLSKPSKSAVRPTTWHKADLKNTALPEYQHSTPDCIDLPFQYFTRYFDDQIIRHITYQTNLYAAQKDINITFTANENEILTFVTILIYMGIVELPSVDDYWARETRVPQVANLMSSKRFRLLKRVVHFNDNTMIYGTSDRFFKIRQLFSYINTAFRRESQTPKQSVDEVMVAYKGKKAGNLRQYIKSKPDKWGFKLFARASEDGFIHDMVLYQGKTTLEAHDVPLKPEQEDLGTTSQIVSVLVSTMSFPTTPAIYADNFFTSLELVRYLRDHNCRYTGTARENRIGKPPLRTIKEMEKKTVPHGTCDYVTSDDGILAVRWKDNKTVTLLSTDMGVGPMSTGIRYCSETKKREPVSCPAVIRSYNANMGGIDKSDMLVHLYRTPMKSKRCSSSFVESLTSSTDVPKPVRGHRSHTPNLAVRFDMSLFHAPVHGEHQTCKHCSRKGNIMRSNVVCRVCKVHYCMNSERNCFVKYHEEVA